MELTKEQIKCLRSVIHQYIFEWVGEDNLVYLTKNTSIPIPQKTGEPYIVVNTDIIISVDEPEHLEYDKYIYLSDFDLTMVINKILKRISKSKAKSIYIELNTEDLNIRIILDPNAIPITEG